MSTQPKLVIIRGVPGSGKSYITELLANEIGQDSVCVLDPDTVDMTADSQYHTLSDELTGEGVDEKFHLYRYLRTQAYQAIEQGRIILWNQPFTDIRGLEITVNRLKDHAAKHGLALPLLVVEVEVSDMTARARVATRKQEGGHGPEHEVLHRFLREYRSVADDGYETLRVDGEADATASLAQIVARVHSML